MNSDPEPSVIYGLLLQSSNKPATDNFLIINIAAIIVLLVFSALVSGSEVAYFSLRKQDLIKNPNQHASVIRLLEQPKRLLATILILNNLINIGIVVLTSMATARIFGFNTDSIGGYFVTGITFVTTFIIVFFGEVLPKVYANQNSLIFASRMAGFFRFFGLLFWPFSWMMITFTNIVERALGKRTRLLTKKDISRAIDITSEENISKEEKDILKGIVNFGHINVKQIMRSRIDVKSFDLETDYHELMNRINKSGYSRYPVFEETVDSIKGVLYIKDLLPHLANDEKFDWQSLIREAYFVPETKMIDDLMKDFQTRHIHMAIVVDEYGGTSGIVTLEDIIEEIVGEINDEFDDDEVVYTKLADNAFIFEGKTSIHDFCKVVDSESEEFDEIKGESESLGGLMLELFAKIPRVGDSISFGNFTFEVESVSTKRVKRIRVELDKKHIENDAA